MSWELNGSSVFVTSGAVILN